MSTIRFTACAVAFTVPSLAVGVIVPFTEEFTTDGANWRDNANAAVSWSGSGGPDDSAHVSAGFNFVASEANATPVILRGQNNFGSSGNAFVGDWIADGVTSFAITVRHDANVPLNFFARFASPAAFPGAVAVNFTPVLPNTWTTLTFAIDGSNPQFINFEGSDFAGVFSNIGRVQVGVSVPASLAGVDAPFTFGLDRVGVVPAPSTALLGLLGLGLAARGRRR